MDQSRVPVPDGIAEHHRLGTVGVGQSKAGG